MADDDDEWCSINEASRRLRVTPTAIRNRVKRGTLETRPRGNWGKEVRVPVPLTVPEPVPPTVPEPEPGDDAVDRGMDALVAELRDRLAELQGRVVAADAERAAVQREAAHERAQAAEERAQAARERAQAAQERDRLQSALVDTGERLARLSEAHDADLVRHRAEVDDLHHQLLDLRTRSWWRRIWAA